MPTRERALARVIVSARVLSVSRRMKERTPTSAVGSDMATLDHVGPSMMSAPRNGILVHSSCRSSEEEGRVPSVLRMQGAPRMIMRVKPLLGTTSKVSSKGWRKIWR